MDQDTINKITKTFSFPLNKKELGNYKINSCQKLFQLYKKKCLEIENNDCDLLLQLMKIKCNINI